MKRLSIAAFLLGSLFAFAAPASALYSECNDAYKRLETLQTHLLVQTRLSDYETACNDAAANFMHPEEFKTWYGSDGIFSGKKGIFFLHCIALKTVSEFEGRLKFEHHYRLAEQKAEAISSSCPAYSR
ncbi:MAG: hypothetical protein OXU78_02880 [Deltaproteobacteria bacterium]|nr:hypothetical protein [Deltaproteobacteria bacterium]